MNNVKVNIKYITKNGHSNKRNLRLATWCIYSETVTTASLVNNVPVTVTTRQNFILIKANVKITSEVIFCHCITTV